MNAMTMNQKIFVPVPPDKGSFPLDHDGKCKQDMLQYMRCLLDSDGSAVACKDSAKSYLQCRMENNLMAKEEWPKLGFQKVETSNDESQLKTSS
ncbi:cytochrome c oxidase assembly protein COX19 [Arctopsyche grandis]|uniref:cytochrome c oxidase assembly protein COX19 n=1 Tax=Arctopsyche grandis TaxID=121162 RepID=UPI00406D9131